MSVNAIVQDGKIVEQGTTSSSTQSSSAEASNGYDKDAFMNILVAQMKYQDPLEPTSNTEYINQYATFTQVEQLSNMAEAFSLTRASDMVGKTVIVTKEDGTTVQGRVDYVTYSGGEAYLNIDGSDYSMDQVSNVADSDFVEAHDQADDLTEMIDEFPDINNLNYTYAEQIYTAYAFYQNMNSEAVGYMDSKYITKLEEFKTKIDELVTEATKNAEALAEQETSESDASGTSTTTT